MTHRYSNLAEAQRAEAADTVVAIGGHIVDMEASNLVRLAEILEEYHVSAELCKQHGESTDSIDVVARMELAEIRTKIDAAAEMELAEIRTVQPDLMLHYERVDPKKMPAYKSRMTLAAILGAKTEDERTKILSAYSKSSLRMMAETAIFGAIDNGDLELGYQLACDIKVVPELKKAFFAA